jgi:hypothetical protein
MVADLLRPWQELRARLRAQHEDIALQIEDLMNLAIQQLGKPPEVCVMTSEI